MMLAVIVLWAVFLRPKFPEIREQWRQQQASEQERQEQQSGLASASGALSSADGVVLLDPKVKVTTTMSAPLMEQQHMASSI
jgi:hypothetical protein